MIIACRHHWQTRGGEVAQTMRPAVRCNDTKGQPQGNKPAATI